jgi:hypothetical protein
MTLASYFKSCIESSKCHYVTAHFYTSLLNFVANKHSVFMELKEYKSRKENVRNGTIRAIM